MSEVNEKSLYLIRISAIHRAKFLLWGIEAFLSEKNNLIEVGGDEVKQIGEVAELLNFIEHREKEKGRDAND